MLLVVSIGLLACGGGNGNGDPSVGDAVDVQPCGGTHVRSTAEIGEVRVRKIEKKGRQNRRVSLEFV